MKIFEIIVENQIDEGRFNITVRDARRILSDLGYVIDRSTGHEQWVKPGERTFPLQVKGKDLRGAVAGKLFQLMKANNYTFEEDIDEAVGLPGDTSTLLSLLSEMANMLGAGSPNRDEGPMRSAVMQIFNNGSADDGNAFMKQTNFRLGSIRAVWMGKNWPQLKSCFLRLKKNPKYQRSIDALNVLGDWPMMLIKDPKSPTASKYFTTILDVSPSILVSMAKFESEDHVRDRAKHMASLIPNRVREFNQFVSHWADEYEGESAPVEKVAKPKDELKGQQAAGAEDIISKVLGAVPPKLAGEIRPQIARMGSQNEKLMFIMQALQKAGIDPHKVLG